MQDIILFATTALFSQVILYYYPVAMDMNQIAIITGACELLEVWSQEVEYMKCKAKPKLIFIRRNMPVQSNANPINPEDRHNLQKIEQFFDIEFRNLINPTILSEEEHLTCYKKFEELAPKYQEQLIQIRVDIANFLRGINDSNIPNNFEKITARIDILLSDTHSKNIQAIIDKEKARIHLELKRR